MRGPNLKRVQKFLGSIFSFMKPQKEDPAKDYHKDPPFDPQEVLEDRKSVERVPYNDLYRGGPKEKPEIIISSRPKGMAKRPTFPSHRNQSIRVRTMTNAPKVSSYEVKTNSPHRQHHQPTESFGSLVKRHRRMRGWRVDQVLKRLGILNLPKTFISSIEEYNLIPDPQIVERLAYVLGASRKEFMNAAYRELLEKGDK